MQLSLTDYIIAERSGWQMPLHKYLNMPESRRLPQNKLLAIDLSQETPDTLMQLKGDELEILCMFWGCPVSGSKAEKAKNLLNTFSVYQAIKAAGKAGLFKLTVPEIKKLYKIVRKNSGSWLTKKGLIESLLEWTETAHEPFKAMLAKARHYEEVSAALRVGKPVPDEVIQSCPAYLTLYRKANGLPIKPERMTGEEWANYVLQAMGNSHMTSREREIERHWRIIERAIRGGERLKPEVLADHERQTWRREIEKQKAIPRGPGWIPADLRTVKPGDVLYRTDGVSVKIVKVGERVIGYNLLYNWEEEPEAGRVWLQVPFKRGDKVRWTSPDGQVKTGWIKHARPQANKVFGEEFFIETGKKFKGLDHPEFFTAPVGEVEKEKEDREINAPLGADADGNTLE